MSNEKKSGHGGGEGPGESVELTIRLPSRIVPRKKRAKIVLKKIREEVSRVAGDKAIKISPELSEMVWSRGIEKPPRIMKLSVKAGEGDDFATVFPAEVERKG